MARRRSRGFTMIELLVGVVVVAILAAIAIPSYSAYIIRGQRAAAKAALEQAAQYLERNYTSNGCYNYTSPGGCQGQTGAQLALPSTLTSAPNGGGAFTYAINVVFTPLPANFNAGQYYLLSAAPCSTSATPCGSPSNASFADATCGALTIDNTGQQGIDPSGTGTGTVAHSGAAFTTCWQH